MICSHRVGTRQLAKKGLGGGGGSSKNAPISTFGEPEKEGLVKTDAVFVNVAYEFVLYI